MGLALLLVIVVAVLSGLLSATNLADVVIGVVIGVTIVAALGYFAVILSSCKITRVERRRVLAFIPMFLTSAAFWSLYQQQFTVVTVYPDQRLDRSILGWEMPVSWVQSTNPVFIILLAGPFAHEVGYFDVLGVVALGIGALLAVSSGPSRRLMSGVH